MQVEREIRQFAARVRRGAFLGGFVDGAVAGALALAIVVLVLRVIGVDVRPAPWWGAPVVLAGVAGGLSRVLRLGFGLRASAQHLDRRLGLEGLLVTAQEVDAEAWKDRLRRRLDHVAEAWPHVDGRRLLVRTGVAALVLGALALLPPLEGGLRHRDPLGAEVLADLERKIETLRETGAIDEAQARELDRRLGERTLKAGQLAKAVEELAAFAGRKNDAPAATAQAAAEALHAAADAGLLERLPPDLLAKLGPSAGGQGIDPANLPADAETLKQLAEALAGLAGDELQGLADAELLEGLDLAVLDGKLEEALGEWVEGEPCKLCDGTDEDCPG